jgi:U3 small nucleolar RNA-associated protein 21
MKKGEVRKLVIPADEGYGADGFPAWGIPPGGSHYSSNTVIAALS